MLRFIFKEDQYLENQDLLDYKENLYSFVECPSNPYALNQPENNYNGAYQ